MRTTGFAAAVATAFLMMLPSSAGAKPKALTTMPASAQPDCTPINGRYGYYGNPWCDARQLENAARRERREAARRAKAN